MAGDVIMLKMNDITTEEDFRKQLDSAKEWAGKVGYKEDDVNDIIKSVRKSKRTMKIHDKIFNRIKELGMTQKEFSQKTGIPQSTISDWKGKNLNPAVDKIMIICDVLELTPNELLLETIDDGKYNSPDKLIIEKGSYEYEIIKDIRQLKDEQRQRLMAYMKGLSDLK